MEKLLIKLFLYVVKLHIFCHILSLNGVPLLELHIFYFLYLLLFFKSPLCIDDKRLWMTTGNLPKLKNSSVTISDVSSGKRSSSDLRNATVEVTRVKKIESSSIVVKKSNMMRDNYPSTVEDSIQASTSGLVKLSLGTNSAKTIMNPRRCASSAEHKPENWELPNNGEEISRQLTIAVVMSSTCLTLIICSLSF